MGDAQLLTAMSLVPPIRAIRREQNSRDNQDDHYSRSIAQNEKAKEQSVKTDDLDHVR
jgi:hypothetical protein